MTRRVSALWFLVWVGLFAASMVVAEVAEGRSIVRPIFSRSLGWLFL